MTTFICNGPRVLVHDRRAALDARSDQLKAQIASAPKEAKGALNRKHDELREEIKGLKGMADEDYLGRAGCGSDLSKQIEALPADGDIYEYRCPKCGNTGTVRKAVPEAA